ncbi:hypothetical protein LBMAG42_11970 [Deltaproteobacteria bacterium]|nr:hypothetical protein LBMAG42_11970 [Deltaproteobacteria bacterium]
MAAPDWRVRRAVADDLGSLTVLGRANQLVHARLDTRIPALGHDEVRRSYLSYLTHGFVVIAEHEDGEAFGLLAARMQHEPPLLHICDAFVARSKRRQGVLRAMIALTLPWGERAGATGVTVDWLAMNPVSSEVWVELGFAPIFVTARTGLKELRAKVGG